MFKVEALFLPFCFFLMYIYPIHDVGFSDFALILTFELLLCSLTVFSSHFLCEFGFTVSN